MFESYVSIKLPFFLSCVSCGNSSPSLKSNFKFAQLLHRWARVDTKAFIKSEIAGLWTLSESTTWNLNVQYQSGIRACFNTSSVIPLWIACEELPHRCNHSLTRNWLLWPLNHSSDRTEVLRRQPRPFPGHTAIGWHYTLDTSTAIWSVYMRDSRWHCVADQKCYNLLTSQQPPRIRIFGIISLTLDVQRHPYARSIYCSSRRQRFTIDTSPWWPVTGQWFNAVSLLIGPEAEPSNCKSPSGPCAKNLGLFKPCSVRRLLSK